MTMKKILLSVLSGLAALSLLAGCGQQPPSGSQSQAASASSGGQSQSQAASASSGSQAQGQASSAESAAAPAPESSAPAEPEAGKTLVVYFSASGNTRAVAEAVAEAAGAEIYALTPAQPYTEADLDWTAADSRVNTEHNDPSNRTAIAGEKDLSGYDTLFLGYPLWWREAPSIVWNFLENSDLSGKTVIPFCTSTSDGIAGSVETLRGMVPAANWLEGRRFGESLDTAAVTEWVNGLDLASAEDNEAAAAAAPAAPAAEGANALVVYFSVPEDVDTAGVDAIAGASVLVSDGTALGNMEYMAGIIQRETGADSYRIVEQEAYPREHQPLIDQAQQEQRNNGRPAIAGQLPDLSGYEVIYLGYPNWWYDLPQALYSFFDAYDFSGKTIIPFNVHNGSRFSGTIATIQQLDPNATVIEDGFTVSERSVAEAQADVARWVEGLGLGTGSSAPKGVPAPAAQTGLIREQLLDSGEGPIHYSFYLPEDYDSGKAYPLVVTMPGYDRMWFGEASSGSNLTWNGFTAWTKRDEDLIVVCAQLTDWGEASARQAICLTEYFIENFAVDSSRVYAAGYSAGGETMSRAVALRPGLYAAYLHGGSQWDGSYQPVAEEGVAVYIFMAENDEYYGSEKAREAYNGLSAAYREAGYTEQQAAEVLQVEIPDNAYFNSRGVDNYHGGGSLVFDDEQVLNWLLSHRKPDET